MSFIVHGELKNILIEWVSPKESCHGLIGSWDVLEKAKLADEAVRIVKFS